ncbi:MAG: transporter substrate-binding domain-containing protein [Clostridia bacterium]|nr:transporter substrate-binding domain-containing protein [Clostridia bacterium]
MDNRKISKSRKKKFLFLTAILCAAVMLGSVPQCFAVSAAGGNTDWAEKEPERIKVAFCDIDGFQETDKDGKKSGYAYDFVQKLAIYSGLRFDFVHTAELTWEKQFEMLEEGTVDMVLGVDYSSERAEKYLFSSEGIGTNSICLIEKKNAKVIDPADIKSVDGKRIGFHSGTMAISVFREFAAENGFSYNSYFFSDDKSLERALVRGEIDLAVNANMVAFPETIDIILEMNPTEIFALFNKKSEQLRKRVDEAISQMDVFEPGWRTALREDHYKKAIAVVFSQKELDTIKKYRKPENTLSVICNADMEPYSWFENGAAKGINVDIFKIAMDTAGLRYTILQPKDKSSYEKMIEEGIPDIIIDLPLGFDDIQKKGYIATSSYTSIGIAKLVGKNYDGKTDNRKDTLAVIARPYFDFEFLLQNYPDSKFRTFQTYDDCVEAVRKGNADATYLPIYKALEYINQDSGTLLTMSLVSDHEVDMAAAIRDDLDPNLLTILTKCLANVSDSEKDRIMLEYTAKNVEKMTISGFLERYPIILFLVILAGIVVAVLAGILYYKSRAGLRLKAINEQLMIITEENEKYQDLLEKTLEKAEAANRAKSIFLSNMSHDIRTPMNAIIGFQTIALAHMDDSEKVRECLQKIDVSGRHLLSLINDVLDMSRIESETFILDEGECTIEELVTEVYNMFSSDTEAKGLEFNTEFCNIRNNYVYADKLHISRVLLNIIGNAFKFTPAGGKIILKVEQVSDSADGRADYEFSIRDTGIGMKPEFVEHVFDLFTRERNSTVSGIQGTGLGMAISRNIVEKMGGRISVESEENKGTVVTIGISLKTREASRKEKEKLEFCEEKTKERSLPEGLSVLIVEDNQMNIEIAEMMLSENGFKTDTAENGSIAVEKVLQAVQNGERFDFILMDVQMPVMDGYEATVEIKKIPQAKDIPIIAMTANAFEEDRKKALDVGMAAHISKPINFANIKETMMCVLEKNGQCL